MAKSIEIDYNFNGNEIQFASWEKLAADPTGPALTQGRFWHNTTVNKYKFYDGTITHVLADEAWVQARIQEIGQAQGGFDASPGALPTAAALIDSDTVIRRGDYWEITTAGTIVGIDGADELSIGDVLKFIGTNPATASHWLGIQRNLNDTLIGNVKPERFTVDLVANVALTVSAVSIGDIHTCQVYNAAGSMIEVEIAKTANANQRTILAKRSLVGVRVEFTGGAAA